MVSQNYRFVLTNSNLNIPSATREKSKCWKNAVVTRKRSQKSCHEVLVIGLFC